MFPLWHCHNILNIMTAAASIQAFKKFIKKKGSLPEDQLKFWAHSSVQVRSSLHASYQLSHTGLHKGTPSNLSFLIFLTSWKRQRAKVWICGILPIINTCSFFPLSSLTSFNGFLSFENVDDNNNNINH